MGCVSFVAHHLPQYSIIPIPTPAFQFLSYNSGIGSSAATSFVSQFTLPFS